MKLVPLKDLASIQLGKMLSPRAKTGKESFPYLRNQNVHWGRFNLSELAEMDFNARDREKFELLDGDLLICEGGEPGRCAVWRSEIRHCYYQKAIHRVRPFPGAADSDFLAHWIRLQGLKGTFEDQNAKTTIAHLPLVRLERLPVPCFNIKKQRRVAAHLKVQLAEVEAARQAAQAQSHDVASLANSIILKSVCQNSTVPHLLGDVLNEVKQGVGSTWAAFPVLGATRGGVAPAKEPPGKQATKYKLVLPGSVFYNPMRILIGSIAFVDDHDAPGITSPDYVVLQGKPGFVNSRWFYYWLRSPLGEQCIASLARGAVRERMLFNRLAEGTIELPALEIQENASVALKELKPLRASIEQELQDIEQLPQRLLAQAFGDTA